VRALAILVVAACSSGTSSTTAKQPDPNARDHGLMAFETVRSVLQHPRCQNCHPAGDIPLQGDAGTLHNQNVQRGPKGEGLAGAECTTCHGPANPPASYGAHIPPGTPKGWHMPPPETKMVFVGMAPKALCEQLKDPSKNGGRDMPKLREHLEDPLVVWGWTPGAGRTPVPTPRAEFLAAFDAWAAAGSPCPQ
jgi:hypothetical protein